MDTIEQTVEQTVEQLMAEAGIAIAEEYQLPAEQCPICRAAEGQRNAA
ncbi:MAG: hypothetical protein M3N51_05770 [Actinomycetota bacterium]|nr:hypothetical protein [Actinomycetota bacterium]